MSRLSADGQGGRESSGKALDTDKREYVHTEHTAALHHQVRRYATQTPTGKDTLPQTTCTIEAEVIPRPRHHQ